MNFDRFSAILVTPAFLVVSACSSPEPSSPVPAEKAGEPKIHEEMKKAPEITPEKIHKAEKSIRDILQKYNDRRRKAHGEHHPAPSHE